MKILTRLPVLALTYLSLPFFASAQIAPSGIFREQPTPTPTPTLTAKSTPTPVAQSSPAQTPTVTSTARTEITPAAKSKKQAAKAQPKPKASTSPTPPVADDDERPSGSGAETVSALRRMEREWGASSHNTATIQRMLADDFIGVTSEGKTVTKKAMLKGSSEEKDDGSSSVGHMDVRLHGAKVAIVVGTAKQSSKDQAGRKSTSSYRFTDTWMERDGNWQCIASHVTALSKSGERAVSLLPNSQTGSNLPRHRY
ncbi:MAG: nuclear transport factor 2 family protein [Verrucomicrobiota bacterium]